MNIVNVVTPYIWVASIGSAVYNHNWWLAAASFSMLLVGLRRVG